MKTYKIIRFRRNGNQRVIKRGLTLEEAQAHCKDPTTRDRKHTIPEWFDGYTEE